VTFGQILADDFKPEKAATRLGEWWLITDNYIKLYPSARYVHCAIDALLEAIAKAPGSAVDPGRVDHVEVHGYRMLVFCGNPAPTSMFGTHFSTPFSIATILVHGRDDLDVFGEEAFRNPAVMALAARVQMIEVPEMNASFPTEIPARVKIVMKDGKSYEGSVTVPKGERGNQHSAAELERKFFQLARPVWGEELARTVRESCFSVDRLQNMRDFAGGMAL
jgi:2-methylcitrate dehydratase PrpD